MKRIVLLALCMSLVSLCQAEDYRIFKNNKDQEIEAKIIAINADSVRLERKDGKIFTIPVITFSQADQEYIKKWQEENIFSHKDSLKIRTNIMKGTATTSYEGLQYNDGTYKEKAIEIKTYDAYYGIELENTTKYLMEDLRVEYLFLTLKRDRSKDKGTPVGGVGSVVIDAIPPHETRKFYTAKLPTAKYTLTYGYYLDGSDSENSDGVEGIHIRVYKGDRLLIDLPNPKSMAKYNWKDFPDKLDLPAPVSGK
jgi:hypothetical protein